MDEQPDGDYAGAPTNECEGLYAIIQKPWKEDISLETLA